MPEKCKVLAMGPGLNTGGGIATVNRLIAQIDGVTPFATTDGEGRGRWLVTLRALARFPFALSGVDVVHIHTAYARSFWRKLPFIRIALLRKVPVVLHVHPLQFWEWLSELPPPLQRIVTTTLSQVDQIIVLSQGAAHLCESSIGRRAVVIPNPMPDVKPVVSSRNQRQFVYLGWIVPEKGIEELLRAAQRLVIEGLPFKLVVAGNKGVAWMKRRIDDLGIAPYVEYAGWVEGQAKFELLASSLGLVLPSYGEGLPMVALESMAVRTPCILTKVGAIPEFFADRRNALLVNARSEDELFEAMRWALQNTEEFLRLADFGIPVPTLEQYKESCRSIWRTTCVAPAASNPARNV